jgi:hypothetical protein
MLSAIARRSVANWSRWAIHKSTRAINEPSVEPTVSAARFIRPLPAGRRRLFFANSGLQLREEFTHLLTPSVECKCMDSAERFDAEPVESHGERFQTCTLGSKSWRFKEITLAN